MKPRTDAAPTNLVNSEPLPMNRDSNVIWSSGAVWDGLIIEQCRFDEVDEPTFQISDYNLILQISPPLAVKRKSVEPHYQQINKCGNICLFSAGIPKLVCAHQQQEVLLMRLSSHLVSRTANESTGTLIPELADYHQFHDAQVQHIGMALKAEAEAGYLSGRLYGESLSVALSVHLLTKYSVVKTIARNHKGGLAPHSLRRVTEYIHTNLAEELRLGELAKIAGLSQHRFAHNFKHTIGLAPHQYVIRERIERAKTLLRETNLTVTEISHAVGCGSPSRFTLLFRRAVGTTPSTYRSSFK